MRGKEVFLVTKEGVYRHEIMGVYLTQQEAQKRAIAIAGQDTDGWKNRDGDGYHQFAVCKAVIGDDIQDVVAVKTYQRKVEHVYNISEYKSERIYGEVVEIDPDESYF